MSVFYYHRRLDGSLVALEPEKVRVIETDDGLAYEYWGEKITDSVSDSVSSAADAEQNRAQEG